jgi:hypothetical protein
MFGRSGVRKIKVNDYVFVVQKEQQDNNILIIGRVESVNGTRIQVMGSYIRPTGLIEHVKSGHISGRPKEVLENPDPNNCIFMLIDRVETGRFYQEIDQSTAKTIWINEKRFFVLDGWIRENLPDMFADVLRASTDQQRSEARSQLLDKMNSLYERDLKEHVYAVARSTKVL